MAYTPPKTDKHDYIHTTLKTLLSTTPFIGAPAAELFNAIISPPIEKRRNTWMTEISNAIIQLETANSIIFSELQKNEIFIDTLIRASQSALKTSKKIKLEALKNATLNATTPSIDESLQHMFISFIDDFSEWHFVILKRFSLSNPGMVGHFTKEQVLEIFNYAINREFPELQEKYYLLAQIMKDLSSRGLIPEQPHLVGNHYYYGGTTELGKLFINFTNNSPLK